MRKMQTENIVDENIEYIARRWPNTVKEIKVELSTGGHKL